YGLVSRKWIRVCCSYYWLCSDQRFMHTACHQVCLDRKSLNIKRLSPYSRSKSVAESFRGWDWLFRFWDAPCNTATQSEYVAVFGKRIIADNLSKAGWSWGYI